MSAAGPRDLEIGAIRHQLGPVESIIAASCDPLPQEIANFAVSAGFSVGAMVCDPVALARLLRLRRGALVVTGGSHAGARPFLQTARAADARAVALISDRGASNDWFDQGHDGVAVLGPTPDMAKFRAAVAASRAGLAVWEPVRRKPRDDREPSQEPLSPRERAILQLVGCGLSNKAVARQLGISPNTVKFHLRAVFEKLHAASRAEAVMAAIRRGEIVV